MELENRHFRPMYIVKERPTTSTYLAEKYINK